MVREGCWIPLQCLLGNVVRRTHQPRQWQALTLFQDGAYEMPEATFVKLPAPVRYHLDPFSERSVKDVPS